MPVWTLFGLARGSATTDWPPGENHGQQGAVGMPRYDPVRCESGCKECVAACLPGALTLKTDGDARLNVDYGRCIACQVCVEVCPTGALETSADWAMGVRDRDDLVWKETLGSNPARALQRKLEQGFKRSLHIRHVDAGSCNGCESELQALNNPFYNLHRLGVFFTPSPRFADILLVTGTVTYAMREALVATYEAMSAPKWVIASGTCAVSGGIAPGGYSSGFGVASVLPVDIYLPGCPPNPAAIINALLMLVDRMPQQMHGGKLEARQP